MDYQFEVHQDALRLVGSPTVELFKQVPIKGCCLPRQDSGEEWKVSAVGEWSMCCKQLVEKVRRGFEDPV